VEKLHSLCRFQGDNWSICDVHCEFDLPSEPLTKPQIKAHLTEAQYRKIPDRHAEFELISIIDDDGGPKMQVIGSRCWFKNRNATYWPHNLISYKGDMRFSGLYVETVFGSQSDVTSDNNKIEIEFRLTPNRWCDPKHIRTVSYTGEVTISRFDVISIRFGEVLFEIDVRYDYEDLPESGKYQASQTLVVRQMAGAADNGVLGGVDYSSVDDICSLVKLASREYVTCLDAVITSDGCHRRHYRLDRVRPSTQSHAGSYDAHLIDCIHAQDFLQQAYSTLRVSGRWGDRLRSAVVALVQPTPGVIERQFVAQFSALEELVEEFTRESNGKRILGQSQFKRLFSKLKSVIENSIDDEVIRQRIERQLPALNNVSLQDRFEAFCTNYHIQYKDLWPVFSGSSASLYKIRNRLVHSRALKPAETQYVAHAGRALRVLLERSVLTLLEWPVSDSDVSLSSFRYKHCLGENISKYVSELEDIWLLEK